MLGNFLSSAEFERVAVTIYGLNLLAISVLLSTIWRYALKEKLVKPAHDSELDEMNSKLTPSLISYLAVLGIGLIFPYIAVFLYLLIAVAIIVPLGIAKQKQH